MAGLAIQQVAPPAPGMASIKKGDILPGSVIEKINTFQFRVRLGGIETVVNSRLPMQVGQRLLLRVEAFSPRLKLKLLASPQHLAHNAENWLPIFQTLGLKNDAISLAIIEHLLMFRLPLRKTLVQRIRQEVVRLHRKRRLPVDLLLEPVGIWYDVLPEAFGHEPLLLFHWYWQDQGFQDSPDHPRMEEGSDSTLLTLIKQLQTMVANGTPLVSWPELGVRAFRQQVSEFYRKNALSGTESLKFKFINQQWQRFLRGQWALFPVMQHGQQFFLHLQQAYTGKQQRLIVDFTVPVNAENMFQVRAVFGTQNLTVHFWNEHQAFRDAVDNGITLFLEKLEGITKFRSITIKPDPHLTAYQGLRDYFREIKLKYTGVI